MRVRVATKFVTEKGIEKEEEEEEGVDGGDDVNVEGFFTPAAAPPTPTSSTAVIEVDADRLIEIEDDPGLSRELEAALRPNNLTLKDIRTFTSGSVAKKIK